MVHQVDDHLRGLQPFDGARQVVGGGVRRIDPHADARRIDHQVGDTDVVDRANRCNAGEFAGGLGRCDGPVDHPDRVDAGATECIDHRPGGSAGPDDRDLQPADVDAVLRERGDESGAVGAGTDQVDAVPADRVDRAQCGGRGVEPVDRCGNVVLVRHRDRQPGDAEHAHGGDRVRAPAVGDVEGGVGPRIACRIEGRLVDHR